MSLFLLGWIILGEKLTYPLQFVGIAFVVIGISLFLLYQRKPLSASKTLTQPKEGINGQVEAMGTDYGVVTEETLGSSGKGVT